MELILYIYIYIESITSSFVLGGLDTIIYVNYEHYILILYIHIHDILVPQRNTILKRKWDTFMKTFSVTTSQREKLRLSYCIWVVNPYESYLVAAISVVVYRMLCDGFHYSSHPHCSPLHLNMHLDCFP